MGFQPNPDFEDQIVKAIDRNMRPAMRVGVTHAKSIAPYDTGLLEENIEYIGPVVEKANKSAHWYLFSDVPYAEIQEDVSPYLRPTLPVIAEEFTKRVQDK